MALFSDQDPARVDRYRLSHDGRQHRLGPHFQLWEFASIGDTVLVHPLLVALLEVIRAHFGGKAVHISKGGGYRTDKHNRSLDPPGAAGSKHKLGMAADVYIRGVTPEQIASYADHELGVGGIGRYSGHTHLDVFGSNRRWSG